MAFSIGLGKLKNLTFGIVIIFFQLFMLVNTELFFPNNTDYWRTIILVYIGMTGVMFTLPGVKQRIWNIKLRDALPKFLIFFGITVGILSFMGTFPIKSQFYSAVSNLTTFGLVMVGFHTFIVAINEEGIFRNPTLERRFGRIFLAIAFGLFHYVVYQGDWTYIFIAMGLSLFLSFIQLKFSPRSQIANMGVHAGYNSYTIGLIEVLKSLR